MPEELEDEFGDIIKKARAGMGYQPEIVAHEISMSVDDIVAMETYRLKPTPEQLRLLASILDLDAGKLADIAAGSWHPAPQELDGVKGIFVERIRVPFGAYGSNSYILSDTQTKLAAVVDPGGAVERVVEILEQNNLSLTLTMITHGHQDHTAGLSEMLIRFPRLSVIIDPHERVHGPSVRHPEDGEEFMLGDLTIKALSTPGHSGGSTCYLINGSVCFVGDTLFAGSVGGTYDNPASYRQELESITNKILSLPDNTILLPGHGPATTVGEEKQHNPFF